jgi:beta-glucanase (GH16 family)
MQIRRLISKLGTLIWATLIAAKALAQPDLLTGAHLIPSSAQVVTSPSRAPNTPGIDVAIAAGSDNYPGVNLVPVSGAWRLTAYGHIEARIVNTGVNPIYLNLRVDNPGNWQDNPWNAESAVISPGQVGTLTTIFGYSYGHKKAFALNPATVVNVLLFAGKTDKPLSFRIESVTAAGPPKEKPGLAPDDIRSKPVDGLIYSSKSPSPQSNGGILRIRPAEGRWDLTAYTEVQVSLKNDGPEAVTPKARIESNGGDSDWVSAHSALPPGSTATITVPFFHKVDLNLPEQTGFITSDAVGAIAVTTEVADQIRDVHLMSVQALLHTAELPNWLGRRPPVTGDWVKTLDDEFDGTRLNGSVWKPSGENYYDKLSHWSKQNVIVKGGFARLRYEKSVGHQNDDPKAPSTAYASGYLDTYGLWTQKYGYFEARMKLPTAPGLWPAFWMMPDRGSSAGPEAGKRMDTANGGMEFDVMEHLTRWGPHRYNIAMHYDGYEKDHKQLGSDKIYVEPDKDGFITCGLLWTPGSATYYCNGREVLSWKSPRISNVPSILMFTLPMGGWDNNDLDDAQLPAAFVIDYVRVWQRKDLSP